MVPPVQPPKKLPYEDSSRWLRFGFFPPLAHAGRFGRYGKLGVRTSGVETWDFNVQYQFHRRLTVFVDIVNAFNEWESWDTNRDRARVTMAEVYGTRLNLGVSGRY